MLRRAEVTASDSKPADMGRYVPPDQEGLKTGNQLAGRHPLGARARHLHTKGALIVRFEMPFAVWCTNCKPEEVIGQGVRFNAEKKKVGNYYSTPIYSFRMKHTLCGGWIEIRTDPKNTAYVVTEGARKKDTGEDKTTGEPGEIHIRLGPRNEQEEKDPFARLEGKVQDKRQYDSAASRIEELRKRQQRDWEDPYEKSRQLRRTFRAERKRLEMIDQANEAIKDRMGLGIDLLEETDEDRLGASLVEFGHTDQDSSLENSRKRPLFQSAHTPQNGVDRSERKALTRSEALAAERKAALSNQLRGNMRATLDPFLNEGTKPWQPVIIRKRKAGQVQDDQRCLEDPDMMNKIAEPAGQDSPRTKDTTAFTALVAYGSDSD